MKPILAQRPSLRRMPLAAVFLWSWLQALPAGAAHVELMRIALGAPIDQVFASVGPQARQADGVLQTTACGSWRRDGLRVGPLPVSDKALIIEYDFRPMKFGQQGQSFVSEQPSTHWYMLYANPHGGLQLHTRCNSQWQARGHSLQRLVAGEWHHATVTLTRTSIRVVVSRPGPDRPLWDTGVVPMDDLGPSTTFILTDEALAANDGATQWRTLVLSSDDAAWGAQFRESVAKEAELQRRRKQEQADARAMAEELRRRGIALIPVPRKLRWLEGRFGLAQAAITFPAGMEAEAGSVRQILAERTNLRPPLSAGGQGGIALANPDHAPWPPAKTRPSEGYRLSVRPDGVRIEAQTPAGFLAAAQTLAQLARDRNDVPALEIVDWPAIENRLVMIAVSQGGFQVIDADYWKRIIRELAAVKINMLMPYFETGSYDYQRYPCMRIKGPDGFTADKARMLSRYARDRGIELLPQQQSLGHAGYVGLKELANLRESDDVLCVSNPATYEFLGNLYDELVAAFPAARWIHVGGDEFGHGFAKCPRGRPRAEQIGQPGLYAEHMMKLRRMLADRGRKMMIWWHEQGYTEAAADRLAKDIAIFDWHYGNQRSYPSLDRLRKLGFENVWATPAVTRYYDGPNDFDATLGNIRGFLTAAAEHQLPGECTCTWCHGIWGGRNLFELNLYALLYSAQCAWKPGNSDEDDFRRALALHWFGLETATRGEELLTAWHAPFGPAREQSFWKDCRAAEPQLAMAPGPLFAEIRKQPALARDAPRLLEVCAQARHTLERWKAQATRNRATIDFLIHDVHIYQTLARRILVLDELGRGWPDLRRAPLARRREVLQPILSRLDDLVGDYREMERMFERSIKEAGGARCGKGSFSGGEIRFRSQEGRQAMEKLAQRLRTLSNGAALPEQPW
jgi:hypothetical protein